MDIFEKLISNYTFISVFSSWFLAQFIKGVHGIFKDKSIKGLRRIVANGGMPSSHASSVSALCVASVVLYGLSSFQFAVSFLFALIVMNDAFSVRYETGKHSKVLKKLIKEKGGELDVKLKVAIGHTPLQVVIGSALGIAIALALHFFVYK
ncbi:MAG: divergent PAP2 family protein [Ruminococcaceae bacterium]|nr:divergent PAP2 family protein [Oscillospiraceae bacterium]